MAVARVSLRRHSIVICMKAECHARKVMHFAAQVQGFVKVTRLRRSYIGTCSQRVVFRGVESRVALGFAVARLLQKLHFGDKSQVKRRF